MTVIPMAVMIAKGKGKNKIGTEVAAFRSEVASLRPKVAELKAELQRLRALEL